jgi:hypothetical protein
VHRQFFRISVLPDLYSGGLPSVLEQCFSGAQQRRQNEVVASMEALRSNLNQLDAGLHQCMLRLLKAKGCRLKVGERERERERERTWFAHTGGGKAPAFKPTPAETEWW